MDKISAMGIFRDQGRKRSGHGMRTPGLLAQRPAIGLLMVLLGGIAFGVMAWSLQTNGPFASLDIAMTDRIHAVALQSPRFVVDAMILGFYLGEHVIVLIILFIGFSRLFVGDHYLMDVLAGYALGIAWCGLAYTAVELLFKRRITEDVQQK